MFKFGTLPFRRSKPVDDVHHVCSVEFLDDSAPLSVTYQKNTKGQFLLDHVCHSLDIVEADYFGLRYLNASRQQTWLDASRSIHKQLKGLASPVLSFRVKFYPSDPTKLKEEITRYQIYLQLKKDFFLDSLRCSDDDANVLAACIIQSELGDYDAEEHLTNYVREVKCLPQMNDARAQAIADIHKTLVGQVPGEAESNFLKKASELDTYGVDPHNVTDMKGTSLLLGITYRGVLTFHNNVCTHVFKWTQICRFEFDGKLFIIRLTNFEGDDSSLLMKKGHGNVKGRRRGDVIGQTSPDGTTSDRKSAVTDCRQKKPTVAFRCPTAADCKQLWKSAVEQKYFFTLKSALEAPRVTSSGGFFRRGSRFRFSGRCEQEVFTSKLDINRKEPSFTRSLSNAQFAQRYNSLRSATLPSQWRPHGSEGSSDRGVAVEAGLNDSFQSSCGAMKDEVVSSVIVEEELVVTEGDDPSKTVICVDVMRENAPLTDGEESEADGRSPVSSKSISPAKISPFPQDMFEWSNQTLSFPPLPLVTQSEPNICAEDHSPFCTNGVESVAEETEIFAAEADHEPVENILADSPPVVANAPDPTDNQPIIEHSVANARQRRWRFRTLVRVLSAALVLLAVLITLTFETQLDLPVITDLRSMPEVQQLAADYYWPLRQAIVDQYNGLVGL